jgi:hypothetical protein
MPSPQADTPTDVALTDVDTDIRLGIGAHSVRIRLHAVKYADAVGGAGTGLPDAPRPSTLPGSMVAGTRSKSFVFAIRAIAAFIRPR